MLVPNLLLQFPNQELLFSVGIFTSYNIGCCVLQPDVSLPREVPGRVSPSLAGAQVHVLCAQRGILRQMVWALGNLLDLLAAALPVLAWAGQPAAHLMPFIL